MAYKSMREFMGKLEAAGELVRVTEPVSTVLEITEIHRRLLATGGPAEPSAAPQAEPELPPEENAKEIFEQFRSMMEDEF